MLKKNIKARVTALVNKIKPEKVEKAVPAMRVTADDLVKIIEADIKAGYTRPQIRDRWSLPYPTVELVATTLSTIDNLQYL